METACPSTLGAGCPGRGERPARLQPALEIGAADQGRPCWGCHPHCGTEATCTLRRTVASAPAGDRAVPGGSARHHLHLAGRAMGVVPRESPRMCEEREETQRTERGSGTQGRHHVGAGQASTVHGPATKEPTQAVTPRRPPSSWSGPPPKLPRRKPIPDAARFHKRTGAGRSGSGLESQHFTRPRQVNHLRLVSNS